MADFCLYVDESGKLERSDYTSFCGFLAHWAEWDRFSLEWNNCRFTWGVPAVHMRCIMHPERKQCEAWDEIRQRWGATWEKRRDQMLLEFASLVDRSHLVCMGTAVDAEHFRKLPDCHFKRSMDNPLYLSFYNVVRNSLDHLDQVYPRQFLRIAVIVDDDEQYSINC